MGAGGVERKTYVAHRRESDGVSQSLEDHLEQVGRLAATNASKLAERLAAPTVDTVSRPGGLEGCGELLGLLHDLGKYSDVFQAYLGSAVGLIEQDADDYVDAVSLRGQIDHSTAGAQFLWRRLSSDGSLGPLVGRMLALCVASHHSGLIDCLAPSGEDSFISRMSKRDGRTHLGQALASADPRIVARVDELLRDGGVTAALHSKLRAIVSAEVARGRKIVQQQHIGLLVRFLFSCLIDADRVDTADFQEPRASRRRPGGVYVGWATLVDRMEAHLMTRAQKEPIDGLRAEISRHCLARATGPRGTYTLTVPTGGGKTLASLRFALHHARVHGMDRVIYVIPFTSIIDQNAAVVRGILEPADAAGGEGRTVLEHHGNLTPERQGWRDKMLSENWDAPLIFTTMVQFLDTLFGAGTRGARRMHQLANAVLVFDEIQTLPIRCVHLFNNAINFLVEHCGCTVVLCTATQPLLDEVDPQNGAIWVPTGNELIPDVRHLFTVLKRVDVVNRRKPGGWTDPDLATLALEECERTGSCLVVVNTKASALALYRLCSVSGETPVAYLSTNLCPAHRKRVLWEVRNRLASAAPIVCISTQLIEAGVDIDFGAVIRFMAGLDSVAQAAGRCNRNGRRERGTVYVVNPRDEDLGKLTDIRQGRDTAERVLDDYEQEPARYACDPIGPQAMKWYYENYFFVRADQMGYPVGSQEADRDDTLLNLLSENSNASASFCGRHPGERLPDLRQAFMTAAKAFRAIDAPTQGVIVPYGDEGRGVVADLCSAHEVGGQIELLRKAQQFTVNVFPNVLEKLMNVAAVRPVREDVNVLHVDPRYYSSEFGLTTEPAQAMEPLVC